MRTFVPLSLLVLATSACAPSPEEPHGGTASEQAAAATRGEAVYEVVCWACHGLGGHGDGPVADSLDGYLPPTFHTQDYATATPQRLEQLFSLSSVDEPEHPHTLYVEPYLSHDGLADAVAYLSLLTHPAEVPGSARSGARIFGRLCAGCHGAAGRGDGELRAFILDEEAIDLTAEPVLGATPWMELYRILDVGEDRFHGTSTPAWGSVLTDAEVWDVVAHVAVLRGLGDESSPAGRGPEA